MTYREWLPAPALRPWVSCYWELADPDPGESETILPDGACELIWHRREPPLERRRGRAAAQPRAFLLGDFDRPVHLLFRGGIDCVGVRFRPGGIAAFVPMPVPELAHAVHDLADVLPVLSRAADRIREASAAGLASLLDDLLATGLRAGRAMEIAALCRLLDHGMASGSVGEMARAAGLSVRQLQRRMSGVLGVSPKRMLRVLRFNEAFRALLAGDHDGALARYYDQAHLLRDFRDFAGAPPTAVLAHDLAINRSLHLAE